MSTISIIGDGNMGKAIASVVTAGGNSAEILTRNDAVNGDIVVLAVPFGAHDEIVAQRAAELAGKVVVDISNPLNFETFDSLVVPSDSSAAAELAAKLPESTVLKAFNTNFAATLATGKVGETATTVLVAGDDQNAKQALIDVVSAAGLSALDAGSLKRARELEAVGFQQLVLAATEKIGWTGGFAVIG